MTVSGWLSSKVSHSSSVSWFMSLSLSLYLSLPQGSSHDALCSKDTQGDFITPWVTMDKHGSHYTLVWESKELSDLGVSLERILKDEAVSKTILMFIAFQFVILLMIICASFSFCDCDCPFPLSSCPLQIGFAVGQVLQHTVIAGLLSAIAWPAMLIKFADLIDSTWAVCCARAEVSWVHHPCDATS